MVIDVVAVARKHESPLSQIAKDFRISGGRLSSWMKCAEVEDGVPPGLKQVAVADRELTKRYRLLEQENEVPRRTAPFFARKLPS